MRDLYSIGAFSKLTGVSVDTLRYYDKIDLLKPEKTDDASLYRYYSHAQLTKLDIIKICRGLGISLEETARLFEKGDPFAFEESLMAQREILDRRIQALQQSNRVLEQLISKLRVFEEISVHSGFYSRPIPPRRIAVAGQPVAYAQMNLDNAKIYDSLARELGRHGLYGAYEGGFIYGLRNGVIEGGTMFERVPRSFEAASLSLEEVTGGHFFCMHYSVKEKEKALALYLAELKRLGLSPGYLLDVYLIDGSFSAADRRFELQCPDPRAGV